MGPGKRGPLSDFGQALHDLVEALRRSAIPYMIGGSMASGIHGIYRTSLDVDLVADMHPEQIPHLIQELGVQFYADAGMMRDALECGRSFNLIHFASRPVATAEDTLLMKLVWYRAGDEISERQWNDVRGIVAVQGPRLDRQYLRQWAAYLKVADLAAAALQAADQSQDPPSV